MIKVELSYTPEHFAALMPKQKKKISLSVIISVGFIIFVALDMMRGDPPDFIYFGIAAIAVLAFISEFVRRRAAKREKLHLNYAAKYPNCRVTVGFGDENITIDSVSDSGNNSVSVPYSDVTSVKLKDGFFALAINKIGGASFRADEITEGTADELCGLLRERIGDRFSSDNS